MPNAWDVAQAIEDPGLIEGWIAGIEMSREDLRPCDTALRKATVSVAGAARSVAPERDTPPASYDKCVSRKP